MASPSTLPPPRNPAMPDRGAPTLLPGGGRQRRWSLALVAVLVTLGSALAFAVLWMNAGGREPVLAMARDVPAGQPIRAEDLRVVRVAADAGIRPVSAVARSEVVGRPAAVDLLAGTLLVRGDVGNDSGLGAGTELIAVPVPRLRLPGGGLQRGDKVVLYRTGGDNGGEPQLIGSARVFEVTVSSDEQTDVRMSVVIDQELGMQVSAAAASGDIYVAKVGAGG